MTEFSGTLAGVGLPAIVRFLTGLHKTGCLRVSDADLRGEIFFDQGQLTSASFGSHDGLSALDAILQVLPGASFVFEVSSDVPPATIALSPAALQAHLDEVSSHGAAGIPALDRVLELVTPDQGGNGEETLPLDRGTLKTLLLVDGQRPVREIVSQRGTPEALWQVATLARLGLLGPVQRPAAAAPAAPAGDAPPATAAADPAAASIGTGSATAAFDQSATPRPGPAAAAGAPASTAISNADRAVADAGPAERPAERSPFAAMPPPLRFTSPQPAGSPSPTPLDPLPHRSPFGPRPGQPAAPRADTPLHRPVPLHAGEPTPAVAHSCSKLGFEDDPSNSFGRPTRLHRCFAAGAPLPLSLDQQRELCLSDQFSTCPRLTTPAAGDAARRPRDATRDPLAAPGVTPTRRAEPVPPEANRVDPRIVRPPFAARASAAPTDRGAGAEPTRFRAGGPPTGDSPRPRPTPLRSRLDRPTGGPTTDPTRPGEEGSGQPTAAPEHRPAADLADNRTPDHRAARAERVELPTGRRIGNIPIGLLGAGAGVLVALAVIGYVVLPQLGTLLVDDSIDTSNLPNTRAIEAGTPVSQVTSARSTPLPVRTAVPAAAAGTDPGNAANPTPLPANATPAAASAPGAAPASRPATAPANDAALAPGATGAASAASAANAAAAPTLPPDVQPSPPAAASNAAAATGASPATVAGPGAAGAAAPVTNGQPAVSVAGATASAPPPAASIFDESFKSNAANWPSNPQGSAVLNNGSYRVTPRQAGQFVAIGAPIPDIVPDVVVNATFHKVSGPAGGGYGVIVRDQGPRPLDGATQEGRYYVLEVGDKGEIGIWRRDADHWVDLLPWQHSDAVRTGNATNELSARAVGSTLSLSVNGTQVATRTDATFPSGGAGLFVGGDGNQVAVDHFSIQKP